MGDGLVNMVYQCGHPRSDERADGRCPICRREIEVEASRRRRAGTDPRADRLDPVAQRVTTAGDDGQRLTSQQIAHAAAQEALDRVERTAQARATGSVRRGLNLTHRRREAEIVASADTFANHTPCPACGVRSDQHATLGCKRRWPL